MKNKIENIENSLFIFILCCIKSAYPHLKTAEILYNNKRYSSACFHTLTALEELLKILIRIFELNKHIDEVKKINHHEHKFRPISDLIIIWFFTQYKYIAKNKPEQPCLNQMLYLIKEHNSRYQHLLKKIKNILAKDKSDDLFESILINSIEIDETVFSIKKSIRSLTEDEFSDSFVDLLNQFVKKDKSLLKKIETYGLDEVVVFLSRMMGPKNIKELREDCLYFKYDIKEGSFQVPGIFNSGYGIFKIYFESINKFILKLINHNDLIAPIKTIIISENFSITMSLGNVDKSNKHLYEVVKELREINTIYELHINSKEFGEKLGKAIAKLIIKVFKKKEL